MENDMQQPMAEPHESQGAQPEGQSPQQGFGDNKPAGDPGAEKSSTGALLGVIIILIVLIVGGLYLWGRALSNESTVEDDVQTQELLETSDSDEVEDIEADLEADLNLEELDNELEQLDSDLEADLSS